MRKAERVNCNTQNKTIQEYQLLLNQTNIIFSIQYIKYPDTLVCGMKK